jgi:hypothetical protein
MTTEMIYKSLVEDCKNSEFGGNAKVNEDPNTYEIGEKRIYKINENRNHIFWSELNKITDISLLQDLKLAITGQPLLMRIFDLYRLVKSSKLLPNFCSELEKFAKKYNLLKKDENDETKGEIK